MLAVAQFAPTECWRQHVTRANRASACSVASLQEQRFTKQQVGPLMIQQMAAQERRRLHATPIYCRGLNQRNYCKDLRGSPLTGTHPSGAERVRCGRLGRSPFEGSIRGTGIAGPPKREREERTAHELRKTPGKPTTQPGMRKTSMARPVLAPKAGF